MVEQIGELKADKEELKSKLQFQTYPEELDQLKKLKMVTCRVK